MNDITSKYPALANAVRFLHENARGGFVSITGYTAKSGRIEPETSDYTINGNVSYLNTLCRSMALVADGDITPEMVAETAGVDLLVAETAIGEQMASWERTVNRIEDGDGPSEDHYEHLGAGAKRHIDTGYVHVMGLVVSKNVQVRGIYKKVNSAPKTIAKKTLVRMTPMGKWRQFRLSPERFERMAVASHVVMGKAA